jgi:hypothetical protein
VQTPVWQVSAPLQRLASAQLVPLDLLVTGQIPVDVTQAPTVVQAVADGQTTAVPAVQTPVWQVSAPLQRLASAQDVPLDLLLTGQVPVEGTQAPTVVQAVAFGHITDVPAVQMPVWQVSAPLQRLPSEQLVPLDLLVTGQTPVEVTQAPTVVQAVAAGQITGCVVCVQDPLWHVDTPLQRLPSSQLVPLDLLLTGQVPVEGTQAPTVVQAVAVGHVTDVPAVQTPVWHVSMPLQRLPSSQLVPLDLLLTGQIPVDGTQAPTVVQAVADGHVFAVPVQMPAWQVSPVVQALPSEQAVPSETGVSTQAPDPMSQEEAMQGLLDVQTLLQQRFGAAVPRTTRVNTTPPKPGTASGTTWL